MAQIGITRDFSGFTGQLITVWYKASAPLVEVGRSTAKPFPVADVLAVPNLDPLVYVFKFYQSSDGTTLNTLLRTWSIDASIGNGQTLVKQVSFIVDSGNGVGDGVHIAPADGDDTYQNNSLNDADILFYTVNKPGFGELGTQNIAKDSGGGFHYTDGTKFAKDEEYSLTVYYKTTAVTAPASQFDGVINFSANRTLSNTDLNKLLVTSGATKVLVLTLNALSSYSKDKFTQIVTHRGGQNNVRIVCSSVDKIYFMGAEVSEIILGKGEKIRIYFDGTDAYVDAYEGDYNLIGTIRYGYAAQLNELALDGTEYNVADWPRLVAFYSSLPASRVVTYTQWAQATTTLADGVTPLTAGGKPITVYPNKGLFALSTDGIKFKVPDFRNISIRTLKFYDSTTDSERLVQGVGGFQAREIDSHGHNVSTTGNQTGTDPGRTLQRSNANTTNANGEGNDPGAGSVKYIRNTGGTETRVDNYGLPAFIKI